MTTSERALDRKLAQMLESFAGPDTPALGEHRREPVRRRVRRPLLAAATVAVIAAAASAPAIGWPARVLDLLRGGTPVPTTSLSDDDLWALSAITSGRLGPRDTSRADDLRRLGATAVRELAERDGRAYYVIDKSDGSRCFGVGYVGSDDRLGQISCPRTPAFPSPSLPILDLAVYHGDTALPSPGLPCCLWRLEGFAADGVTSVAVETAGGALVAVTPVVDNVYVRSSDLPSGPVRAIVALNANGDRVFTECLDPGGC